jgi:carbon monoxide dehydrogenase subunit G
LKLHHSFQVGAPLTRVWAALIDVERVAPCLPGAELTEMGDDGTYRGTFIVRLGPTTAAYEGELKLERLDESTHTATMRASGRDKRGQGSAKAAIVTAMREDGAGTTVEVETDFTLTGRLARFGRGGMIRDVSNRLLRDFASCLQQTIEGRSEAAAQGIEAPADAAPQGIEGPAEGAPQGGALPASGEARAGVEAPEGSPAAPSRATTPQARPVRGISLLLAVLRERIERLFARRRS